jgi:hypothetical protein
MRFSQAPVAKENIRNHELYIKLKVGPGVGAIYTYIYNPNISYLYLYKFFNKK